MWEIRRKTSLLLSHGHTDAGSYPLGFLNDESTLVTERQNGLLATEGVVLQAAAGSIMSKEGGKHFKTLVERLSGE